MAWHGVEGKARQGRYFPPTHTHPKQPGPAQPRASASHAFPFFFCHTILYFSIPLVFPFKRHSESSPSTLMRSSLERRICFSHASSPDRKFLAFPSFPSPIFEP
ncbi:hypothetical protein NW765_004804 [Fusarium oxysporum]|nr:hypothetical protein NW765_004804 [Fusarium oxysporum]